MDVRLQMPDFQKDSDMRHILNILLAVVVVTVALSACDGGVVYDKYKPTPVEGWEKNDTLIFDVPKLRLNGRYGQEIGLRINGSYPFTALSLLVERVVEPGHKEFSDTLDCRLYDGKGNILGSGISTYQYNFSLPPLELREGDSLHVTVRHIMKREILPGISDIGFRLTRE